jgi:hypothetical protein
MQFPDDLCLPMGVLHTNGPQLQLLLPSQSSKECPREKAECLQMEIKVGLRWVFLTKLWHFKKNYSILQKSSNIACKYQCRFPEPFPESGSLNPFSTEPVLQITLFFTCSKVGALLCNYLLDEASFQLWIDKMATFNLTRSGITSVFTLTWPNGQLRLEHAKLAIPYGRDSLQEWMEIKTFC